MAGVLLDPSSEVLDGTDVHKFAHGAVYLGDEDAGDPGTNLVDADGKVSIPSGYWSLGFLDSDGVTESRDLSVDDTTMWQSTAPVRSDVTADALSLKFKVGQLFAVASKALRNGTSIADEQARYAAAVYMAVRDISGSNPSRRLIFLATDPTRKVTVGAYYPSVQVSDLGDTQYQRSDPTLLDVTLKAYAHPSINSDRREYVGGAGWATIKSSALSAAGGSTSSGSTGAGGAGGGTGGSGN